MLLSFFGQYFVIVIVFDIHMVMKFIRMIRFIIFIIFGIVTVRPVNLSNMKTTLKESYLVRV